MTAAEHWAEQLRAWALPQELLDSAEQSPYGHPAWLWKRRADEFIGRGETTPSMEIVERLAGPEGSVR